MHKEEEIKERKKRCEKKMKERVTGEEKESGRSVQQIMKKRLPGHKVIQGTGSKPYSITT